MRSESVAQRRAVKIWFDDQDMDYYLMLALANATACGAEFGECFYTASRIKEHDPSSWVNNWSETAQRVEEMARASLAQARQLSAREAFLRASTYYRCATICIRVHDPEYRATWEKARTCFQQAAALFEPQIEPVLLPYKNAQLPAYFIPAGKDGKQRPTLLFTIGGEGTASDGYFMVGAAGVRRGYNVLAIELPLHMGTRLLNPDVLFTTASETVDEPLKALVDYALSRPEVDPERLGIIGFSAGGAFASRAAMFDKRIKACIADSPIKDLYALFKEEFPPALQRAPAMVGDFFARIASHRNTTAAIVLERTCWQVGATSLSQFLESMRPLTFEPAQITCPMLCLVSRGEGHGFLEQAKEVYDALTVPKHFYVFSIEEGADAHCQLNNFSRMQQVVYDWLDEVFAAE